MPRFLRPVLMVLLVSLPVPAVAQSDEANALLGGDRYIAGATVSAAAPTEGDLFLAGERATVAAPVAGSAHIAGRRLSVDAPVSGNLYAMGYALDLDAPVEGSVTATGAELTLAAPITGNLRASGWEIRLAAPVAGSALIAGEDVTLAAPVAGDLVLAAGSLRFEDGAEVGGTLTIYADDPDDIAVPETVAPADRVTIHDADDYAEGAAPSWADAPPRSLAGQILGAILWVVVLAGLVLGLAALMPARMRELRTRAGDHPGASLLAGFLGLSTITGAGFVAALTVIGLVVLPAAILAAVLAMLLGYLVGVYALGAALWSALGRAEPSALAQKALMALLGAAVAGAIGLVPFLGWLFGLALGMVGLGAAIRAWRAGRAVAY